MAKSVSDENLRTALAQVRDRIPSATSDLENDSGWRKITVSSSEPSSSDGSDGDIWIVI